jgi:hypothetical protein
MRGLCRRHLLNRLERGTGQRSAGSMLEAGAEVKAARIPETNDRVAANRVLRAGFAMRYRAARRHLVPEISAESLAYSARCECLLLSDAGTGDDRANFGDPGVGGGLEENVRREGTSGVGGLNGALRMMRCQTFKGRAPARSGVARSMTPRKQMIHGPCYRQLRECPWETEQKEA